MTTTADAQFMDRRPAPAELAMIPAVFHQSQVCVKPTSPVTTTTLAPCCVRGLSTEAVVAMTTGLGPLESVTDDVTHQVSHLNLIITLLLLPCKKRSSYLTTSSCLCWDLLWHNISCFAQCTCTCLMLPNSIFTLLLLIVPRGVNWHTWLCYPVCVVVTCFDKTYMYLSCWLTQFSHLHVGYNHDN